MFSVLSLSLPHGSLYAEGTIKQMWCIPAVLLWSFFMAFYHSITQSCRSGLVSSSCAIPCTDLSSSGPFHTQTHTMPACIMENIHTSKLDFSIEPAKHLHPWTGLSDRCRQHDYRKRTFSQLLGVQFGYRLLVCVQWFMFCLSDHLMITLLLFFFSIHA